MRHSDGSVRLILDRGYPVRDERGTIVMSSGVATDITERRQAESAVKRFLSGSPAVIYAWLVTPAALTHAWTSDNVRRLTGHEPHESNDALWWLAHVHPEDAGHVRAAHALPYQEDHQALEFRLCRADGEYIWVLDEKRLVRGEHGQPDEIIGSWSEITARVSLEAQLRQAQKMEAVGSLAGGIAHDFNNLLTIISGTTELILQDMPDDDADRDLVVEVQRAGERAVGLTRQLLAFSRKQVLAPKTLDLNDIVIGVEKMLRRLIGEDVTLTTTLSTRPAMVYVDPGQIEQVLLNLAVNARDAMPRGGQLVLESGTFEMTPEFCRDHAGSLPGHYAWVSMRDTGTGMAPDVQARVFEPFFTTKEPGKGTGLGLAMVFGTVKQSDGYVDLWSEPGVGTRFTIYLPAVGSATTLDDAAPVEEVAPGRETVLVVEDDASVRRLARRALERYGYTILEAPNGPAAVELSESHAGPIDLLVTDVVMPRMSGADLADRLVQQRPALKVLLVSGYIDDAVIRHGVVMGRHAFLHKPFMPPALAAKVRSVLDGD
ncbi:MAG: response regulator [Vicinamibacterales bacterium]